MTNPLHKLAIIAALVAFAVIVLGAYVRLSHAGLGCPDWPGCYGHLTWPAEPHEVNRAEENFPHRPVEAEKACDWSARYASVIGFGSAELVDDPDQRRQALDTIMAHYSERTFTYPPNVLKRLAVIRVRIEHMTGKRAG